MADTVSRAAACQVSIHVLTKPERHASSDAASKGEDPQHIKGFP